MTLHTLMPSRRKLITELTMIVVFKLLLIFVLWWLFVRDAGVPVDDQSAAQHMVIERTKPHQGEQHAQ